MALKAHSRPRGLLAPLFALLVLLLVLPAPLALAKNVYEIQDSSEGDPGDGVLRPRPEIIIPDPDPSPRTFNILVTVDTGLDWSRDQAVLLFPLFYYSDLIPSRLAADRLTILLPAGRWHDAP